MLLIAGHHGSGKTTLLRMLEAAGFQCFESSKILIEIYNESHTNKQLWDWVIEVRSTYSSDYLSGRISNAIKQSLSEQPSDTHRVAVSGARGPFMRDCLRKLVHPGDEVILIWLQVPEKILYKRYNDRLRLEAAQPVSAQEFKELLRREEEYGLDPTLMKPDVTLTNDGEINEFFQTVTDFLAGYDARSLSKSL